jgi:hypothetical protein
VGVHKLRRSPRQAHAALRSLVELRTGSALAEGDWATIEDAAAVAFEAEVAMQALAGKGSLPRRVRAELHEVVTAQNEESRMLRLPLADLGMVEFS